MTVLQILLILWAGMTTLLVVLLIYRGTLSIHEDDQLFLDEAESHMRIEQEEIQVKMSRLEPYVRVLGAGSGVVLLVMATLWVYQGWMQT